MLCRQIYQPVGGNYVQYLFSEFWETKCDTAINNCCIHKLRYGGHLRPTAEAKHVRYLVRNYKLVGWNLADSEGHEVSILSCTCVSESTYKYRGTAVALARSISFAVFLLCILQQQQVLAILRAQKTEKGRCTRGIRRTK